MKHTDAETALRVWYKDIRKAKWESPADLLRDYSRVSILGTNRAVFRLHGNHYRLIAEIHYGQQKVLVRFIGTHAEYDRIDAQTIKLR